MKPKRVLMISEHGDPLEPLGGQEAGGQNVFVYELAKALSRRGVTVDVYTRWDNRRHAEVVRFAKRAKVIRVRAGSRHFIRKDLLGPHMPEFLENILRYTREHKYQYDIIHAHYYFSGWAAARLKEILKIPFVVDFHTLGFLKHKALGDRDSSPSERMNIEKEVMEKADLIIATSPEYKKAMIDHYSVPAEKINIMARGVSLKKFRPLDKIKTKQQLELDLKSKIVLFAGKMEERKGGITLLKAIKYVVSRSPDLAQRLKVYMISGDPRKERKKEIQEASFRHVVKNTIKKFKLTKVVQLMPGMPQEVLHKWYVAADVVVMPSYYEPFGMVAIEAMASGTPVIASRTGGLQWTIIHRLTGYLFRPKFHRELAKRIVKVLTDDELRKRMSLNARDHINHAFSWESIAEKTIDFYQAVLKREEVS